MDRKSQYKHKVSDISKIRSRQKEEENSLRKDRKEKLLSSKRFRFVSGEDITDAITHEEVLNAVQGLSKSGDHRKENLKTLRQAFSQGTAYIDTFFKIENSLSSLVSLYTGNDADLQLEASWCITNISAGTHDHSLAICKYVAPYLVTYLGSPVYQLQDQSAWALGNLAGDSLECKRMVQAQGVVAPLIQLLQSPHPSVVQSAAFALSNLAKDSVDICREMIQFSVISHLLKHLQYHQDNNNIDILAEVAWVFTYLATSGDFVEELSSEGVITRITEVLVEMALVTPHIAQVVTPLLRCLGNICSGPDQYTTQANQNKQLLSSLGSYLTSDLRHVKKETLWVLSNMSGEPNCCKAVAYGPLLPLVLELVPAAFDIKTEALYLLCNIACHGEGVCCHLVDNGMMHHVSPVLKSSDVEILNLGLSLCEMALRMAPKGKDIFEKECDGYARLEALEYHNNDSIREIANHLLDLYYGEDDEG